MLPKILFLTETFYPPVVGGLEKHAYHLSSALVSKGTVLLVITRKMLSASAGFETVGNVPIKRISPKGLLKGKGWRALGPILFLYINVTHSLTKYLRFYDIILVSGIKVLSMPAVMISRLSGKKCIIKIDSPAELLEDISSISLNKMGISQASILIKLFRHIKNSFLRRADCFIAISSEIEQGLLEIGINPQRIWSIPNGVDIEKFSPVPQSRRCELRQKLSLRADKVVFIFTGRLSVAKGLLLLIQAWEQLTLKYPNIYLLIIGSGTASYDSCEESLHAYIRAHHLYESVSLVGEVNNVSEYLQASDIFVFPSYYEGLSLALLEALACGLPVIATRVGAAEQVVRPRENGILISPKNQQEIQLAMEWLLKHEELWATLGAKARNSIIEKYSIEAVAEKYLQMFAEIKRSL
jgi:glycosyltransferase involved in cell wall biosynthesis